MKYAEHIILNRQMTIINYLYENLLRVYVIAEFDSKVLKFGVNVPKSIVTGSIGAI